VRPQFLFCQWIRSPVPVFSCWLPLAGPVSPLFGSLQLRLDLFLPQLDTSSLVRLQAIARARVRCCSVLLVRGLRFPCEYKVPTSRTYRPTQGCVSSLFIASSPAFVLGARWSDLVLSLFCLSVIFRSSARRITLVAGGFGSSVLRVHVCAHQVLDKMLELLCRFRL
jgi:hypothetical protein